MAMTEEHKKLLKVNHTKILDRIVDVDIILDNLLEMEIISSNTSEKINVEPATPRDKARKLLFTLPKLSEKAYHAFLLALQKTNQIELARFIDPNYDGQDNVDKDDKDASEIALIESYEFDDLPQKLMSDAEILMHVNNKSNYKLPVLERNSDMKIGRVLIINNKDFDILENRSGSDTDIQILRKCFERLRFVVEVHEDKTALEMEAILREECGKFNSTSPNDSTPTSSNEATTFDSNHHNTYIFILIIMSHGAKDHIYGRDGYDNRNLIAIETVQTIFSANNCKALAYKPKLFFVQACQRDVVKPMASKDTNVSWRKPLPEVKVGNSKDFVHPLSDMFLMMSTVLGDLSWRDPIKGSYFIRTIVYVIITRCHEMELSEMMRKVKQLLSNKPIQTEQGPVIQQPEVRDTLRKGLWFLT